MFYSLDRFRNAIQKMIGENCVTVHTICYGKRPSRFTISLHFIQVILSGQASKSSVLLSSLSIYCNYDFLTLLGFQNQGGRTIWVSGAVHKRADSVPGVAGQGFRAVFRACDSQVLSSQFPCFSSDQLPKAPLSPQHVRPIPFYAIPATFCNSGPFTKIKLNVPCSR